MRNLRREALVVHQQELNFPDVADKELFEAVGEDVASLFVASITDLAWILSTVHCALNSVPFSPWAWAAGP